MSDSGPLRMLMLGAPLLYWSGERLEVGSRKSLALLCLLAIRSAPLSRSQAASLLWKGKLANLRQALYQLRQLPGADQWLDAGDELRLNCAADVTEFERHITEGDFKEAIDLWRGSFLSSLDLTDEPELQHLFDEELQRLEELYRRALAGQADNLEQAGDLAGALACFEALLRTDVLFEDAIRNAMRLEFLLGRSAAARQRFDAWRRQLEAEYGTEPEPETVALAAAIGEGRLPVGSRLTTLIPRHRQLLAAIYVSRGHLDLDDLSQVLRRDAFSVSEDVESLRRAGIIRDHQDADGASALQVTTSDAGLLELRIAELLEVQGTADWMAQARLAGHWLRASNSDKAAPWFLKAAKGALAASQLEQAVEYSFRASWAGDQAQRFEAMLLLESVCDRRGDDALQTAALDEADSLAWELQDDAALCRIKLARARSLVRRKQNSLALHHAEEAMEIAMRTRDPTLLALAYNGLGVTRFGLGELAGALEAFTACADLAVAGESMRALGNMGAIHGMRENHDEAYGLFDRALTLAREVNDLATISACLNNLSASAERLGAYDRALRHLHEGRQLAKRLGHRSLEAQQIHNLSVIYMRQGAYGPAWNTGMEVVEEGERTGDIALTAQGLGQVADVARQCGAFRHQQELLERSGELLEQLADHRRLVVHRAVLAVHGDRPVGIPPEVSAVGELGLRSLYNWLLLELSLLADDPEAGLVYLAAGGWQGPHQQFVAEIARMRLLLLKGNDSDTPEVSELAANLSLSLATHEFAEAPKACHLLWLASRRQGQEDRQWLSQRDELLVEQARGLPREIRESHTSQVETWPASVEAREG